MWSYFIEEWLAHHPDYRLTQRLIFPPNYKGYSSAEEVMLTDGFRQKEETEEILSIKKFKVWNVRPLVQERITLCFSMFPHCVPF